MDNLIANHASKIGFLFISFVVVASGYVTQVIPCQSQKFFQQNVYSKHVIGWLICFLFIMLEGGWSFDMETQDKAEVDWSNGNVIDTLIYGLLLYIAFLLTAKMSITHNLMLYFILFGVYLVNTQRLYWSNRNMITEETNESIVNFIKVNLFIALSVFIYGFVSYFNYEKKSYGKKFNILTFLLGHSNCAHVK